MVGINLSPPWLNFVDSGMDTRVAQSATRDKFISAFYCGKMKKMLRQAQLFQRCEKQPGSRSKTAIAGCHARSQGGVDVVC